MHAPPLRACLEDLERRIEPEIEEDLRSRWERFLRGRHPGAYFRPRRSAARPPRMPGLAIGPTGPEWPHVSVNQALADQDAMLLQQYERCSRSLSRGDGDLLAVRCNYGTGILPSLFGAELFVMDDQADTLPTTRPLPSLDAVEALLESGVPDLNGGLGAEVFAAAARFRAAAEEYPKIGRWVAVYHPDLQGPMDVCELLCGSRLFLWVHDHPELVRKLLDLVTRTYRAFMERWLAVFPASHPYSVHWSLLHRGVIMLRDDSAMNFSPADFDRLIRPFNEELLDALGGGAEHFCGRGDHFIGSMCRMRGLYAVHMSQPECNDMETILANTVDRGIVLLGLDPQTAERLSASGRALRGLVHTG